MKPLNDNTAQSNDRILASLVAQIYARSNIGIIATLVNASILVAILWEHIPSWKLLVWLTLIVLVSLIRSLLNRSFAQAVDKAAHLRRWHLLLVVGLAVAGALWGSTAIFLFPFESVAHQVFIAFVLAGMVAGAVGVFSPLLTVFLVFSIPALLPIIIRFLLVGDDLHLAMAAMTTLFAGLTFTTAQRVNRSTTELIALKETFADRLTERTAELQRVNQLLRQEIEERKQTERALADSERRLTDIIEFLPDPTWVIDIDGRVIAWNRAIERITGIDKREIVGKGDYSHALPFYGERRPTLINLVLERDAVWEKAYANLKEESGLLVSGEAFQPSLGEGGRYVASTASRLFDTQGKVVGAIESIRDITDTKRSERERERLITELKEAVTKVRTLTGLLPICASCKKIRDDKGYWNQLESYISDHSEAAFSHSICPECAAKLYPGFDDD